MPRKELEIARDYLILIKPRVIWLLIMAALAGYLYASLPHFSWAKLAELAAVGLLTTGGSAAFNMYWERDIDAKMGRTSNRPLPAGRIKPGLALAYSIAMSAAGLALAWAWLGAPAACAAAAGWAFYAVVYTIALKRRHWSNILLGGFAGNAAFLSGWLASRPLTLEAVLASFAVWLWIPAHIWSLAYVYREEYREAGVPMLTALLPEGSAVALTAALNAASAAYMLAFLAVYRDWMSLAVFAPAAAVAIYLGLRAVAERGEGAFWRVFKASSPLLAVFFIALLL